MTLFGITTYPDQATQDSHRQLFGSFGYTRFFFGPGARYGWARGPLRYLVRPAVPVVSFKTWNEPDYAGMIAGADGPWVACFSHEPEKAITAGTLTPGYMTSVYERMAAIRSADPKGGLCSLAVILNSYQLTVGHFDPGKLAAVCEIADLVTVDSYTNGTWVAQHNAYPAAGSFFAPLLAVRDLTGKPTAAPELGVHLAPDGDDGRRATWLRSYVARAAAEDLQWASYWCHPNDGFHLDDPAVSGESLGVWRTAVAATARPNP